MDYSSVEACEITGATMRQLVYWVDTGRIPGQPRDVGSGRRRRWTADQLDVVTRLVAASAARRTWDTQALVS